MEEQCDDIVYELPFLMHQQFQVLQGYGGAYSHTGDSFYSIDFEMPEGAPVCAARQGIVYRVTDHFTNGGTHPSFKPKANVISILHPDDTISSYAHLIRGGAQVRPGQQVQAGQLIGRSGNTGWSGTPHLHFHVADGASHERIATRFNTAESGAAILETGRSYTRPLGGALRSQPGSSPRATLPEINQEPFDQREHDPFAFSPELFELRSELMSLLESEGFDHSVDYTTVDVLHDVHGLEVCGIGNSEDAFSITRLLLRTFPGWSPGWLHSPDNSSSEAWVASIQRDRDPAPESWEVD